MSDGQLTSQGVNNASPDEQNQGATKLIQNYKYIVTTLVDLSKLPALIGAVFGLFYLFAYTVYEGIPFPIELSVLPTLIMGVGLIGFIFVLVLGSALFLPAITQTEPPNVEYLGLFAERVSENSKVYVQGRELGVQAWRYVLCSALPIGIPIFGYLVGWGSNGLVRDVGLVVSLPISILWLGAVSWLYVDEASKQHQLIESSKTKKQKRISLFAVLLATNALSFFSYLLFVLIVMTTFPEWFGGKTAIANENLIWIFLGLWLVFTVVNFTSFVPVSRIGEIQKCPDTSIEKIRLKMPIPFFTLLLVSLILFVSVIWFPLSHKLGEAALRTLGIGGGVERSFCFTDNKIPNGLPPSKVSENLGCTADMNVLFDAGESIYAKTSKDSARVFRIKRDEIVLQSMPVPRRAK